MRKQCDSLGHFHLLTTVNSATAAAIPIQVPVQDKLFEGHFIKRRKNECFGGPETWTSHLASMLQV
jgi:hypothetical protein